MILLCNQLIACLLLLRSASRLVLSPAAISAPSLPPPSDSSLPLPRWRCLPVVTEGAESSALTLPNSRERPHTTRPLDPAAGQERHGRRYGETRDQAPGRATLAQTLAPDPCCGRTDSVLTLRLRLLLLCCVAGAGIPRVVESKAPVLVGSGASDADEEAEEVNEVMVGSGADEQDDDNVVQHDDELNEKEEQDGEHDNDDDNDQQEKDCDEQDAEDEANGAQEEGADEDSDKEKHEKEKHSEEHHDDEDEEDASSAAAQKDETSEPYEANDDESMTPTVAKSPLLVQAERNRKRKTKKSDGDDSDASSRGSESKQTRVAEERRKKRKHHHSSSSSSSKTSSKSKEFSASRKDNPRRPAQAAAACNGDDLSANNSCEDSDQENQQPQPGGRAAMQETKKAAQPASSTSHAGNDAGQKRTEMTARVIGADSTSSKARSGM